jgi:hypothetical protein
MKKRINPSLIRNSIYNNFLEYSNVLVNNNIKSLIVFQDEEIKKNIIKFLNKFNIKILTISIFRNINMLNLNLSFYNKSSNFLLKRKKMIFLSKLNFIKFDILNTILLKKSKKIKNIIYVMLKKINVIKKKTNLLIKKREEKQRLLLLKSKINSVKRRLIYNVSSFNPIRIGHLKGHLFWRLTLSGNKNCLYRGFSTLIINPLNTFYNKYKYYSIKNHIFNNYNNNNLKFEKNQIYNILKKRIILDSLKYYNLKLSNIFMQKKLLNILHIYTGYPLINIISKNILLSKNFKKELKYNKLQKYTKFFIKNCNINKIFKNFINTKLKIKIKKNLRIILLKKNDTFLRKFPFYLVKQYKPFLSKIYYFFKLKNYDIINKFKILRDSFRYIYKRFNSHFFRAFKFYKSLISKLFRLKFLRLNGIKIIFKGRFGKVRKQISKLCFGSLRLNTILQKVTYFNSLILTKRGSYGFHMWFAFK